MVRAAESGAPGWPGADGSGVELEYDTALMRRVAEELERQLAPLKGPAHAEGYTTGSLESVQSNGGLTERELGSWPAASAFTRSVGMVPDPGGIVSLEQGNAALRYVYRLFVTRYEEAVQAIRANADEYDRANPTQG
ncbi:hypothetical protein [Streptosporangium sp. NBC_01469]|uniref:hypothetical protein n=1 Tax=Streptosporangium sp. NBC_01469 TaxID=2903898 RepID=UPI002E2BF1D5|nr:hypothetical protein [Streptosporangium sp. NBC_01469]